MATATVQVMEWNGNSVKTDQTSGTITFQAIDSASPVLSSAISIPTTTGVTQYSYEKWLRLRIASGTAAAKLTNLKFYTDGGNSFNNNGNAVFCYTHEASHFTSDFRSATQNVTTGTPTLNPVGGSGSKTMTTIFSYTAAGAYSLSTAAETFSGSAADIGRFLVMIMRADATAIPGYTLTDTLNLSYDEF